MMNSKLFDHGQIYTMICLATNERQLTTAAELIQLAQNQLRPWTFNPTKIQQLREAWVEKKKQVTDDR